MNGQKVLFCLATISLLFSAFSCSKNTAVRSAAENNTSQVEITPQTVEKTTKSQVATETVTSSPKPEPTQVALLTDEAKFLAGMKVDKKSSFAALENNPNWKAHATFFNRAWDRLEEQQLVKIRNWASRELKPIERASKFIFYPFSGPDFLYCYSFFPQARTYVLLGLEPLGSLPALKKSSGSEIGRNLQRIEQSLGAVLRFSFFRTNDMKVELAEQGVLPILFVFLARTNNQIQNVQYVGLRQDATVQTMGKEKSIPGVKIDFVPSGSSQPRSLYYFSMDLSNPALRKTPEFNKFLGKLGPAITYLKAASYLTFYDNFSIIRNLILSQSTNVLQDDSGIPVKYFDSQWKTQFYGNYMHPIALFSAEYQKELSKIYQGKNNVKPLSFGIGYQYKANDSNLMLATRKK